MHERCAREYEYRMTVYGLPIVSSRALVYACALGDGYCVHSIYDVLAVLLWTSIPISYRRDVYIICYFVRIFLQT